MRRFCSVFCWCYLLGTAPSVFAQFATVINVPPSTVTYGIGPNTQLNLSNGGVLPSFFDVGSVFGMNTNLEVNISGGVVERYVKIYNGARVNISGGAIGSVLKANLGAKVTLSGGEFMLNGAPIAGLDVDGQIVDLDLPVDSVLTGTLADGTPITLSPAYGDEFDAGVLRLKRTAVPPVGPAQLTASTDAIGHGVRGGQTLTVDAGGYVPGYYMAGRGSTINVLLDGTIEGDMKLAGATLNVDGGYVGGYLNMFSGSVVNLSQGKIDSFIRIGPDSTVNMTGGELGYSPLVAGGELKVSGGFVGDNFYVSEGRFQLSGGTVEDEVSLVNSETVISGGVVYGGVYAVGGRVTMTGGMTRNAGAGPGAQFEYSGGEIREALVANAGAELTIVGGEFRINGAPVSGASAVGDVVAVEVPDGAVISGTLASGVPFAFSSSDYSSGARSYVTGQDGFESGTLRVRVSNLPAVGPANLFASTAGPLAGIRDGQTLTVDGPNFIGDRFHAGHGSIVNVPAGGVIGGDFEAAGTTVNVTGGTIGYLFDVFSGTTVNLSAGHISGVMDVMNQGVVKVTGGSVGAGTYILAGGRIELSAGSLGDDLWVYQGGLLSMTGGTVGKGMFVLPGGTVDIDGGLIGENFGIRGVANLRGGTLAGAIVVEGGTLNLDGGVANRVDVEALGTLHFDRGVLDGPVKAATNSTVAITGGELRGAFVAEKSHITISGGKLGTGFDAAPGATVQVSGGSLGTRFAPQGPLTILGGDFEINGVPVAGLDAVGNQASPVIAAFGDVLTGTLADGTPFALTGDEGDGVAAPITLRRAALPAAGPAVLTASSDPLPLGVRSGQTLNVDAGSVVTRDFSAGRGSVVNVLAGGQVESNLEAVGATVNITGGSVGQSFGAFTGTVVTMSSGAIGSGFAAYRGSVVNIAGGTLGHDGETFGPNMYVHAGSTLNITGGEVRSFYAYEGSRLRISGGVIEQSVLIVPEVDARISGGRFDDYFTVYYGSDVQMSGGVFDGNVELYQQGSLELFVTDAKLGNGALNLPIGQPLTITARDLELSGRFAEGQRFNFHLGSTSVYPSNLDYFAPNATLTVTRVLSPGDFDGNGVVNDADYPVWLAAMSTGNLAADGNYDRQVTEADLQVWQARYGTDYRVPESSSLCLAAVCMAVLGLQRRRAFT